MPANQVAVVEASVVAAALPAEIADRVAPDQAAHLNRLGGWRFYATAELVGAAPDWLDQARVVVLPWTDPVPTHALLRLPRLELVVALGTGVWDYVDVPALTARAVAVSNVRAYASDAVAEHALALLMALVRDLPGGDRAVRAGAWQARPRGRELAELTLGLVGLGAIGTRVAQLARALGLRVIAHVPHPERVTLDVPLMDLPRLLEQTDVVSLHAPWRGGPPLLGPAELARMRPGAILLNTARGRLVDEAALAAALADGRLGAAGLDVFADEPLPPTSPLLRLPNVLLTPHCAANTDGALRRAVQAGLDNLLAYLGGQPTNIVNPEVLALRARRPVMQEVSAS